MPETEVCFPYLFNFDVGYESPLSHFKVRSGFPPELLRAALICQGLFFFYRGVGSPVSPRVNWPVLWLSARGCAMGRAESEAWGRPPAPGCALSPLLAACVRGPPCGEGLLVGRPEALGRSCQTRIFVSLGPCRDLGCGCGLQGGSRAFGVPCKCDWPPRSPGQPGPGTRSC